MRSVVDGAVLRLHRLVEAVHADGRAGGVGGGGGGEVAVGGGGRGGGGGGGGGVSPSSHLNSAVCRRSVYFEDVGVS